MAVKAVPPLPRRAAAFLLCVMVAAGGLPAPAGAQACLAPGAADQPVGRALVTARQRAVLSAGLAGRISAMPLRKGDTFAAGDSLVRFACEREQAELDRAQAAAREAQAVLKANKHLAAMGSSGDLETETAAAKLDGARADVAAARATVAQCELKAPWAGRVVDRKAQPEERIGAGEPVLEIVDHLNLEVEIIAPSSWLAWLREGASFELCIDETGLRAKGKIVRLGAQIDPVSQSLTLRGALDKAPDGLLPGMSGSALFLAQQRPPAASSPQGTPPNEMPQVAPSLKDLLGEEGAAKHE